MRVFKRVLSGALSFVVIASSLSVFSPVTENVKIDAAVNSDAVNKVDKEFESFGGTTSFTGPYYCPGTYTIKDLYSWYELVGVSNDEKGFVDAGGHEPETECGTPGGGRNHQFVVDTETINGITKDMKATGEIWIKRGSPNDGCSEEHNHTGAWFSCSGVVNRVGEYKSRCNVCDDDSKSHKLGSEAQGVKCNTSTGIHKINYKASTGERVCVHCPYKSRGAYEEDCGKLLNDISYKFNWGCIFTGDKPDGSGTFTDVVGDKDANVINGTEETRKTIKYGGDCTLTMQLWNHPSNSNQGAYALQGKKAYWTKDGSKTPYKVGGGAGGLGGDLINYAGPCDATNGLHEYSITLTNVTESDHFYQFNIELGDGTIITSPKLYVDTTIIFFDYSHDDGIEKNELEYNKGFLLDDTGTLHNRDNKKPVASKYNSMVESRAMIPNKTYQYNDGKPDIILPRPLLSFEYKIYPRTVGVSDQSIRSNNSFKNTGSDGVETNNYKVVMPDDFVKRVFDYTVGSDAVSASNFFNKTRYNNQSALTGITYHNANANGGRYMYQIFHSKQLDKWVLDTDKCQGHELIPNTKFGFTETNLIGTVIKDTSTPDGVGIVGKHWGYAVYKSDTQSELGMPRPERYMNIRLVDGMTGDPITADNITDDEWNKARLTEATKYNSRVSGSNYNVGNFVSGSQTAIGGSYSGSASRIDNKGFPGIYLTYRFKFDGWYTNGSSGLTPIYHQHSDACGKEYDKHRHTTSCYKSILHEHTEECYRSYHSYHFGDEKKGGSCYKKEEFGPHEHNATLNMLSGGTFADPDVFKFSFTEKGSDGKYVTTRVEGAIVYMEQFSGNMSNLKDTTELEIHGAGRSKPYEKTENGVKSKYTDFIYRFTRYDGHNRTDYVGEVTFKVTVKHVKEEESKLRCIMFPHPLPRKMGCFGYNNYILPGDVCGTDFYAIGCNWTSGQVKVQWSLNCDKLGTYVVTDEPRCEYGNDTDTGDRELICTKTHENTYTWACGKTENTVERYEVNENTSGAFKELKTDSLGRVKDMENLQAYAKWSTWDSSAEGRDFELPQVDKPGYTFLGWYTVPQYSSAMNNSNGWGFTEDKDTDGMGNKANYAGGGYIAGDFGLGAGNDEKDCKFIESAVNVDTSDNVVTLYAWYNRTPVFVDVYEGQFFEGQMVTVDDLLSLISAFDVEGDYHNAALKYIYNLPEIDEMQVYFEIHLDENNDYTVNEDGEPVDANEKTIKYVKKDGKIFRVINDEAFDQNKEVVWIDGVPYQLKKEFEQVITTTASGEEIISWKNTAEDKQYWTVESKMKLESLVDKTTLTPIIESIQYEVTDGVPSSSWGEGAYCKVGDDGVVNNWGRSITNYYNRFDTKDCFSSTDTSVLDKERNNIDRVNFNTGAEYISARDSEIAAWRKGADGQLVNKGLANRVILDTSSSRIDRSSLADRLPDSYKDAIGHFTITYKVTDGGIMCDGGLIREHHDGTNINEAGVVDWDSKTTVKYTRECVIQYNNAPNIYVRNLSLFESDEDLGETITISKVFANELVLDAEDCVDNAPWWFRYSKAENSTSGNPTGIEPKTESGTFTYPGYLESVGNWVNKNKQIIYKGYTYNNLQDTLFEVRLYDIRLATWLSLEHKGANINQAVKDWEKTGIKLADVRALKNNNSDFRGTGVKCSEVYNAILSYGIELDAIDQFGKYASGRHPFKGAYNRNPDSENPDIPSDPNNPEDPNFPDVPIEVDSYTDDKEGDPDDTYNPDDPNNPDPDNPLDPTYHQPIPERTVTIYKVNITHDDDMLAANVREYVRYISKKWVGSLTTDSYWEDDNYGRVKLEDIFDIYIRRWTEFHNGNEVTPNAEYTGAYTSPEHGNTVNITVRDYSESNEK